MQAVKIESIFEEKTCTTCGRFGVDQYSSIVDNYIKYKNKLISFIELIRDTLDYQPTPDICSMEICDMCKVKLQEFYNFKMRSIQARKIQENVSDETSLMQLDEATDDPLVYNTVQIVRDYIRTNSIKCIQIEENERRLLIISPAIETPPAEERHQQEIDALDDEERMEPEYLEDENEGEMDYESVDDTEITPNTDSCSSSKAAAAATGSRRSRHLDDWKCNKRKKLRNSGQAYVNTKGHVVEGRKMLPSSCGVCRNRCNSRLSEEDRQENFTKYWGLGDIVEQRKFIFNHIVSKEPTRRKSVESARSVTLEFYLDKSDGRGNATTMVQVCKKMFKNTLAVSNQVIQGVCKKYAATNFVDSRGKHERKLTAAQELAKEHVQEFPFFYLEQTMNKVQIYNLYVELCKEKNVAPVKESNYREIFDRYNCNSFLKSEKVLCEKCHRYYKATDEERVSLQREHDEHIAVDKKCRDRAFGRIRHKRSIERKRAEKLKATE